ncbi:MULTISPECIES: hypothetical protein [unclassified Burkholderia]|uniref:hypothetical protein n=1 Tax=unclassified Burkholderia TaxID=2613784 RepID=UPI00214FB4DB|nr:MULTISPECIES: hypothetical protein [unclassified Burkholderia]MCR4471752.1 hypothetical protein [Burkholderia sp. SCN-KJ]
MSNHPSKKPRLDEAPASTGDERSPLDRQSARDATVPLAQNPGQHELQEAAGLSFGHLCNDILSGVIRNSEDVASNQSNRLQEHLRIGHHFSSIRDAVVSAYVAEHGDTPTTRKSALKVAYDFLTREFHKSKATVRLYIRCYEKLASNIALG